MKRCTVEQIIEIRKMVAIDVDQVTDVYARVMHPAYMGLGELKEGYSDVPGVPSERSVNLFRESLISHLEDPQVGIFVASVGDEIVGFAIAVVSPTNEGHIECWLEDTGVSHEWRHRSIGRRLVTRVLEWGAESEAKYFMLEVGVQNKEAQRLYESLGYQPLSTVFWRNRD